MSRTKIIDAPPVGFEILKALAQFRYLTTKQMLAMGFVRDRKYLGQVLASLLSAERRDNTGERKPKEIGELDFGVRVGQGRLHRIYWLTKLGAETLEVLQPDLAPVNFPSRVVRFAPDYDHRVWCVDFHLALAAWSQTAGHSLTYRSYFDWSPTTTRGKPQPSTRLALSHKYIDADAIFHLQDPTGTDRAFVFEMANGVDTGRILKKMQHIARGIDDASLNRALGFPAEKAVRVVFVFEHRRTAELTATRSDTFPLLRTYCDHFFLKAKEDLAPATFADNWLSLDPQTNYKALF